MRLILFAYCPVCNGDDLEMCEECGKLYCLDCDPGPTEDGYCQQQINIQRKMIYLGSNFNADP